MVTLSDSYTEIVKEFSNTCSADGASRCYLRNYFVKCSPGFIRNPEIEKYIFIDIERKKKYIRKKYWNNLEEIYNNMDKNKLRFSSSKFFNITADNDPCIVFNSISKDTLFIFFRSSRVYPTLYIDLLVISEIAAKFNITKIHMFFQVLWVMKESILLKKMFGDGNADFNKVGARWDKYMLSEKLNMGFLRKFQSSLKDSDYYETGN